MKKFKESDIQVNNGTVSVKVDSSEGYFNWICVAHFYHNSGVDLSPDEMARKFAELITE